MNSLELLSIQSQTIAVLREVLGGATRVALVDFPNHENSGDSLIYLGELAYLKQLNVQVDYVTDYARYDKSSLEKLAPEGPILIHGGGNFGDRWESLQLGREGLIGDFPDRQIIQLPQTIDFREGPALARAQSIYSGHSNLTLLIRDQAGVALTRELFPSATTLFCPDMAFGYGMIEAPRPSDVDVIVLKRGDLESVQASLMPALGEQTVKVDDWGLRGWRRMTFMALHAPGAAAKRLPFLRVPLSPLLKWCYLQMAKINVINAVNVLSQGQTVLTDRLHAAVLGVLMGKNVVALDNANGKISAIMADYLGTFQNANFAENLSDAQSVLIDLYKKDR